ncbi:hypothetical protein [Candidatus Thiosymbion oneisti]|uniref:hypothetical protein n=1 Tax=Candidatus Thiosymbion oneisti TaxID=589554 RepID=UPI000A846737|nr:hypothetical protein [Candidatus Thiosymbion oneisti]
MAQVKTTAIRLGLIELRRSTPFLGGQTFTGRWDFLWLGLLLGLTLAIALLLLVARQGILDRLLDVSLAMVPGHGVPVWVRGKARDSGDALSRRELDRIAALDEGLRVYPYRDVLSSDIRLPGTHEVAGGEGVWRPLPQDAQGVGEAFISKPLIWAVSADDPLWRTALSTTPALAEQARTGILPLVVLNRRAFRRLDCGLYSRALAAVGRAAKLVPDFDFGPVRAPTMDAIPDCLRNGYIWLRVKPGKNSELHRFRIQWVDRLPTFDEVAMLFPMNFYTAMKLAQFDADLHFFPEQLGAAGIRLTTLEVHPGRAGDYSDAELERLRICLGLDWQRRRARLQLPFPVAEKAVETCAREAGLRFLHEVPTGDPQPYLITGGTPGRSSPFRFVEGGRRLCLFPTQGTRGESNPELCGEEDTLVVVDPVRGNDFDRAIVYVPDRERVSQVMNRLEALTTTAGTTAGGTDTSEEVSPSISQEAVLTIPGPYRDAVRRFGFMTAVVELFRWPFGIILSLSLLVLSLAQIGMVIQHRRLSYGVYLAKGMDGTAILVMLMVQVLICLAAGLALACLVLVGASYWLAGELALLLAKSEFAGQVAVTDLALLPFEPGNVLLVGTVGLLFVWLVTVLLLYRILFKRHIEPAMLLYD